MRHPELDECFHSNSGALTEATELYVNKSGIEAFFQSGRAVRVLDVGFGLGYNALATYTAWRQSHQTSSLEIVSLEIDPELVSLYRSGTAPWQSNWSEDWLQYARGEHANCKHTILLGDALTQDLGSDPFDFIWQDPFSPAKNPSMWSKIWFEKCRRLAVPDCVLMTYSVARSVRDALLDADWRPEKIPATSHNKRHWLTARPNTI